MATAVVLLVVVLIALYAVRGTIRKARYGGGCCGDRTPATRVRVKDRNPSHYPFHYRLRIEGMHCGGCKTKVENALNSEEGVWGTVNLSEGTAEVGSKAERSEDAWREMVRKAGYILIDVRKI